MTCTHCPFAFTDESDEVQNYGCLPTPYEILSMKVETGHNWSCHEEPTKICAGFASWVKKNRGKVIDGIDMSTINFKEGKIINADLWQTHGFEAAIGNT